MSDSKVVSITQKEMRKSEFNKEDRWNKVLQNIERINEILLKAGEPSLLGFLFVDLSMLTANIENITEINYREAVKRAKKKVGSREVIRKMRKENL